MSAVQDNLYKGTTPRCWVRLRFRSSDGALHERELLADTGNPCAVILGLADLALLRRAGAQDIGSNFGTLSGAWIEVAMPELGLTRAFSGYGSDRVWQAARADCSDFAGLAGLPLLRELEYGGNARSFWLKPASPQ